MEALNVLGFHKAPLIEMISISLKVLGYVSSMFNVSCHNLLNVLNLAYFLACLSAALQQWWSQTMMVSGNHGLQQ